METTGKRRERRRAKRLPRRISCVLSLEGRRHAGIVLDVSTHGLFVQTKSKLKAGTPVRVQLNLPGRGTPLVVEARVARERRMHPVVEPVWPAGVGLEVKDPPPSWRELVETFAARSFCVRAALIEGAQTRTVLVRCASEAVARELVLAELGEEWKVLSVESPAPPLEATKPTT